MRDQAQLARSNRAPKSQADPPMLVRDIDADGFVRFNEAFGQQVGFSPQELRERPFVDWIVDDDRASALAVMRGDRSACAFRHRTHDGQHIHLVLKMSSQEEDAPMLLAHSPMSTQSVSPNGALDDTVKGTLAIIANIVEEQNPEYRCSILLVKDGRFVRGAGPSLPESYNDAIDGYPIGPTVGSCGTAIFWNVPVIVSDIQKDPPLAGRIRSQTAMESYLARWHSTHPSLAPPPPSKWVVSKRRRR